MLQYPYNMPRFFQQAWVQRTLFFLTLLLAWDAMFRFGLYEGYLFPSPDAFTTTFVDGWRNGTFAEAILVSFRRLAIGYGLSIVLGIGLGTLLASNRLIQTTLGSVVTGLQALPSICWLPFALIWFGLNEAAVTFVVIMGASLAITVATEDALRNVAPVYFRAGEVLGARGWRLYTHVILPAAFPAIVTGLKLGWSFAWRSLMAAEIIFASASLGHLLSTGRLLNDMSLILCVMALIVLVGLSVDRLLFGALERTVRTRWGFQPKTAAGNP
jgi:NitT/TauT family transport system permease protein